MEKEEKEKLEEEEEAWLEKEEEEEARLEKKEEEEVRRRGAIILDKEEFYRDAVWVSQKRYQSCQ